MKSLNFLLVIFALLVVSNTGFSQSESKAAKKTDKLDTELKSENASLALSESQKEQIIALHTAHMNEVSAFKNNNSSKEEVKAKSRELKKAMNAKIRSEILTPEQADAHKAYRKKMKGKKGKGAGKANKSAGKNKKQRIP